ncbi:hypothetical protein KR038_003795, partial [Drosophila bunnanda]
VFQINNVDISHLPRYEAVQKFLQAEENLVVELSRQKHNHNAVVSDIKQDGYTENVAKKQNNEEADIIEIKPETSASTKASNCGGYQQVNSITPLIFPAEPLNNPVILTLRTFNNEKKTSKEVQTQTVLNADVLQDHDLVQTITDHFIEQEHHIFEQCLEPEIDIEEITLTKAVINDNTNDIGIYICSSGYQPSNIDATNKGDQIICNDTEGVCEDVFISGIEPKSIAQNDGRLRQGDQILRINGMDVKNKEEAVLKISESSTAVTLLVSRILYPEDEDDDDDDIESNFEYANTHFLPDDYTNVVDKLDKVLLSHVHQLKELSGKEGVSTTQPKQSSPTQKQNLTSTNSSLPKKIVEQPSKDVFLDRKNGDQSNNIRVSKNNYDESEHIYETIPEDSESEPLYCSPYQSSNYITKIGSASSEALETSSTQQQTERVAQWLGLKSPKTTIPSLVGNRPTPPSKSTATCSRVFTLRSTTSRSSSSGYARNNNVNGGNKLVFTHEEEVDNSSSAYNTGGSNNSASPQVVEDNTAVTMDNSGENRLFTTTPVSSMLLLPFGKSGRIGLCSANLQTAYVSECQTKGNHEDENIIPKAENEDSSHSHCPQFNAPNLSHYHFVSSQEVASKCHESSTNSLKPNDVLFSNEPNNTDEIPMVWKVKRRPDGSRYIVKRPVRNRVPQVSASIRKNMRYNEVTTTEDDTVSEVKIGRYWTKEERKRHMEKARERRQQQQQQQKI